MASDNEILQAMTTGINFGGKPKNNAGGSQFKTKARGKGYKTGVHGSGAAKHKAEIRQRVKNRASQKKH